jgi:hypothetical protein
MHTENTVILKECEGAVNGKFILSLLRNKKVVLTSASAPYHIIAFTSHREGVEALPVASRYLFLI